MKNYFKKFSIMFMMALAIIGIGMIYGGNGANAATVGQQLALPENGWQRIDDDNNKFLREGSGWVNATDAGRYEGHVWYSSSSDAKIKFSFYGKNIRIIGLNTLTGDATRKITIDSESTTYSEKGSSLYQVIAYEKTGLTLGIHTVTISASLGYTTWLDAIDIDSSGYLLSPSIDINKSSIDLTIGDAQKLIATTTPASAEVTWTSSDTSIATVDSTGNVIATNEGVCAISAKIADGSTAICTVTVTKKDDPQPTQPSGDANLLIELVDGQIKQYTVSQDEINKFTSWFENRDKDHSLTATYKFTKGTYKDYVVHDQIDWFEVR
ncbi:Ig-like domain-containing protein [Clostridium sp. YIM B02555]|uniref:Ig-like domain-containing protein n=1 Tax=Clostridium sp. YIM B02555 TaxID=2911968 RepID=UPI001EEDC21D|nr:Ig-like domain-containing protein [Clostridium sp. YIM B02555]